MGQDEVAVLAVERETMRAGADGQHQHGRRAIDGIAGGHLLVARLEVVGGFGIAGGRPLQYRENGADRDIDVAVRRAVERVEDQHVTAARILVGNAIRIVHFLGRHAGELAAPFAMAQDGVVGQHIQLLLHFALHVGRIQRPGKAGKRALADQRGNGLDRRRHVDEQGAHLAVLAPRLFDHELGEGGTSELHGVPPIIGLLLH